jgi:hypothetical protein
MLALAIQYGPQLQECYQKTLADEKCRYYMHGIRRYFIPLEPDDANKLQYVSLGVYGNVLGLFECNLNRETMTAYEITAIRFTPEYEPEFAADMYRFVVDVIFQQYGMQRVIYNVIKGNKAEKLYDRICERYGGRIVGTFTEEVRLYDGKLYDLKFYEMLKERCLPLLLEVTAESYRSSLGGEANE